MLLEFSEKLIDWFWEDGIKREKEYAISTSDWTKNLYDIRKELMLARQASLKERPAFAIWGPSQTGKSTLVSSYVDENAKFVRQEGEDGKGSGLHWDGGLPAFFMAPVVDEAKGETIPPWVTVLNPFNGGLRDASACLSRFVLGSLNREQGAYHVPSAKYPVELQFVQEKDLLHALARGYDTECRGPGPGGLAIQWTLDSLQGALDDFKNRQFGLPVAPNRRAYELLHDFCEVLDDLVFAELPRFLQLLAEGEANWKNVLSSLLSDKLLIANEKLVEEFAAKVLWDGYPKLTAYYQRMNTARQKHEQTWRGKTIHCSIPVAALLLDMDACKVFFDPIPPNSREGDKPAVIHDSIPKLGYKLEGSRVYLGFVPEVSKSLNLTPEDFAILQGLVWEMVVPMNPANLSPSPFLQFLKRGDLLDFPGVGNEKPEMQTQTRVDPQALEPQPFFLQILKRGKTASIVSTYAKRLTIDGFSIFQNIDKYPPVNAGQLHTGINTWWKSMVPDYYRNQEGPSPLPLNLALCWWATIINQEVENNPILVGNAEHIWKALGKIGHPDICTTFSLNYYSFVRGKIIGKDFSAESRIYRKIKAEPSFQAQFRGQVSLASFDRMAGDQRTGGTNYFFEHLSLQVDQCRANPRFNRSTILKLKEEAGARNLVKLMTEYNLFPPPPVEDARLKYLEDFQNALVGIVEGKTEKQVRAINHSLREYLDIDYTALQPVPSDHAEINGEFVRGQYQKWINSQVERYRVWRNPQAKGRRAEPDWSLMGISGERQFRSYLEAMVASIDPDKDMRDIALWLVKLAHYRAAIPAQVRPDLRRHLAVKMANVLVYGRSGIEPYDGSDLDGSVSDDFDDDNPPPEARGKACPSYRVYMKPFVEAQLDWLSKKPVQGAPITPPELPGEESLIELRDELVGLCPQCGEELKKAHA